MTFVVTRMVLALALLSTIGTPMAGAVETLGGGQFPISMSVWKTANPAFVVSGTVVTFRLGVFNTSARDSITITAFQDDVYGNLDGQGNCSLPQLVIPGNSYSCTFPGTVTGAAGSDHSNTISVTATDALARVIDDSDETVVGLVAAPAAVGTAEISNVALTSAVPEPGAVVTMRVDIFNTGSANVTINSMIDSVYGDLDGQGSCALPQVVPQNPDSGVYTCTYPALISGSSGTVQTNTLLASGMDSSGNSISGSDTTSIQIVDSPMGLPAAAPVPGLSLSFRIFAGLLLVLAGCAAISYHRTDKWRSHTDSD
jgi:hypothetical protein